MAPDPGTQFHARARALGHRDIGRGLFRTREVPLGTTSPGNYFGSADRTAPVTFQTRVRITGATPQGALFHFGTADHCIVAWIEASGVVGVAVGNTDGLTEPDDGVLNALSSFGVVTGNEFDIAIAVVPGSGVLAIWVEGRLVRDQTDAPAMKDFAWSTSGGVGEFNRSLTAPPDLVPVASRGAPSGFQIVEPLSIYQKQVPRHLSGSARASGSVISLDLDFLTLSALPSSVTFTRASTASYFDSAGVLRTAAINAPRLADYNPSTLTRMGFRIEGARTNLLLRSEEFSNASWSKTNVTVTADVIASPSGVVNADKLAATASAGTLCFQTVIVASTACCYSIFLKQGSGATDANVFLIRNSTTATNLFGVSFNYTTGVVTTNIGSGALGYAQNCGNGWWRLIMAVTAGITSGNTIVAYAGFTGSTETAGEFAYVWGAQLEAATFPSSYIPTTTAAVTRSADLAVITGAAAANIINNTEGTLFAEFAFAGGDSTFGGSNRCSLDTNDGTNNEWHLAIYNRSFAVGWASNDGGVTQSAGTVGATAAVGSIVKAAYRYRLNDTRFARDGVLSTLDTACTMPTCDRIGLGSSQGTSFLYGHLRKAQIYRTGMPDAQLQAITAA